MTEATNEAPAAPEPSTLLTDPPTAEGQAAAGQGEQGAGPAAKPEEKPAEAPEGAPEAYEFTPPEGHVLDDGVIGKFSEVAKELNLPQDKAQKAVDFFTAKMKASADASATAFADLKAGWRKDAVADTSIGTGTQIKPEVLQSVGRAIDNLGPELSKGFREAMNLTGVGDNPAFIKAFYAMAAKVTEGRPTAAQSPAPVAAPGAGRTSLAAAIYPNLPE